MPVTDPFHPCWSAPLHVCPSRSEICAAPRHQNLSQSYWWIDHQFRNHRWTRLRPGYFKTHTSTKSSPPYQKSQLQPQKLVPFHHDRLRKTRTDKRTIYYLSKPLLTWIGIQSVPSTTLKLLASTPWYILHPKGANNW